MTRVARLLRACVHGWYASLFLSFYLLPFSLFISYPFSCNNIRIEKVEVKIKVEPEGDVWAQVRTTTLIEKDKLLQRYDELMHEKKIESLKQEKKEEKKEEAGASRRSRRKMKVNNTILDNATNELTNNIIGPNITTATAELDTTINTPDKIDLVQTHNSYVYIPHLFLLFDRSNHKQMCLWRSVVL